MGVGIKSYGKTLIRTIAIFLLQNHNSFVCPIAEDTTSLRPNLEEGGRGEWGEGGAAYLETKTLQ